MRAGLQRGVIDGVVAPWSRRRPAAAALPALRPPPAGHMRRPPARAGPRASPTPRSLAASHPLEPFGSAAAAAPD